MDILKAQSIKINEEFRDLIIDRTKDGTLSDFIIELKNADTLHIVFPEIIPTIDFPGGKYHLNQPIFNHLIATLKAIENESTELQLAALLHDIGKPEVAQKHNETGFSFHCHEIASTTIAYSFLRRLKFHHSIVEKVALLVRHHMFRANVGLAKPKTIRKWLFNVGKNNWQDLFKLRQADRQGNLAKKHKAPLTKETKKLYDFIVEHIKSDAIIFKEDLKISEKQVRRINKTTISVNNILHNLVGLTNVNPLLNNEQYLQKYLVKIYGKNT